MPASAVTLAVEGGTDAAVARRLLQEAGLKAGPEYITGGKSGLDRRLEGFSNAARFSCWLVLRDLDHDGACAPGLKERLHPRPAPHLRFHVVVRAIEAWLLADVDRVRDLLGVPRAQIGMNPDGLDDPKRYLLDLAERSRHRRIREAMLPAPDRTARIGPGYNATLLVFIANRWRPEVAAERSPSLARLRTFLRRVACQDGRSSEPRG